MSSIRCASIAGAVLTLAAGVTLQTASADEPGTGEDQEAPSVKVEGLRTCILSHGCYFFVASNEPGDAVGEGVARVSGAPVRLLRFKPDRRSIKAYNEIELHWVLRTRARRAVKRALQHGRRVTARLKVSVTDAAGNRVVRRRTIPIVLN